MRETETHNAYFCCNTYNTRLPERYLYDMLNLTTVYLKADLYHSIKFNTLQTYPTLSAFFPSLVYSGCSVIQSHVQIFAVCFVGPPGSDEEDFFDALDYQAEEFEVALPHNQPKHRYARVPRPLLDFFKTYFES